MGNVSAASWNIICWQKWDSNPRPFGPRPERGALDHSAILPKSKPKSSAMLLDSLSSQLGWNTKDNMNQDISIMMSIARCIKFVLSYDAM